MSEEFEFSIKAKSNIAEIIKRYPEGRQKSALLPLLHLAQEENGGWLSVSAMDKVAAELEILPIEVYEVASFYSMYHLKKNLELPVVKPLQMDYSQLNLWNV